VLAVRPAGRAARRRRFDEAATRRPRRCRASGPQGPRRVQRRGSDDADAVGVAGDEVPPSGGAAAAVALGRRRVRNAERAADMPAGMLGCQVPRPRVTSHRFSAGTRRGPPRRAAQRAAGGSRATAAFGVGLVPESLRTTRPGRWLPGSLARDVLSGTCREAGRGTAAFACGAKGQGRAEVTGSSEEHPKPAAPVNACRSASAEPPLPSGGGDRGGGTAAPRPDRSRV